MMGSDDAAATAATNLQPLALFVGMLVCCTITVGHILRYNFTRGLEAPTWKQKSKQLAWCAAVFLLSRSWLGIVTRFVPEPYLVSSPGARKNFPCSLSPRMNFFMFLRPKSTATGSGSSGMTRLRPPPACKCRRLPNSPPSRLTARSYVLSLVFRLMGLAPECSTADLRHLNGIAISLITLVAWSCGTMLGTQYRPREGIEPDPASRFYSLHTAVNVALFPPLFFFSALYYTDVASALVVLACYQDYHDRRLRLSVGYHSAGLYLRTVFLGVTALLMRQTNVFWVVIFLGGLEVTDAVKTLEPRPIKAAPFVTLPQMLRHYLWRYSLGDIHDPPISYASPDGKCAATFNGATRADKRQTGSSRSSASAPPPSATPSTC